MCRFVHLEILQYEVGMRVSAFLFFVESDLGLATSKRNNRPRIDSCFTISVCIVTNHLNRWPFPTVCQVYRFTPFELKSGSCRFVPPLVHGPFLLSVSVSVFLLELGMQHQAVSTPIHLWLSTSGYSPLAIHFNACSSLDLRSPLALLS